MAAKSRLQPCSNQFSAPLNIFSDFSIFICHRQDFVLHHHVSLISLAVDCVMPSNEGNADEKREPLWIVAERKPFFLKP